MRVLKRAIFLFGLILLFSSAVRAEDRWVVIKKGENLVDSLVAHDISRDEAILVANALSKYEDLSRLTPGTRYVIRWEKGVPLYVIFPADVGRVYTVDLRRITVKKEKLSVKVDKRFVYGILKSGDSVFYSIYEKTGDQRVAYQFVRIFRHRIDFHTWTRPGDYYAFVCEYLEDSFGNARYGKILVAKYVGRVVRADAVYYKGAYYDSKGYSLTGTFLASPIDAGWLRAPLRYKRISSRYTWHRRHPILGIVRPHLGVDYAAPMGTPIRSVADGVVIWKGWIGGYGRTVKIRHKGGIISQYAHMSRYASGLRVGQRVKKGQVIGYVGMSGLATGPHLDFRIKVNGRFVNPLTFLRRHAKYKRYRVVRKRIRGKALEYVKAQLSVLEEKVAALGLGKGGLH